MYKPFFFQPEEFENCTPSCSIDQMDSNLLLRLDIARRLYDSPIILTSAYREPEYEILKGRDGSSSHCKGLAVDIHCTSSTNRMRLVRALQQAGFFRIGIARTYIHADIDPAKVQALWLYD